MYYKVVFPIIFGVFGVSILLSLGFWQVQRLAWKTDLLTAINERLNQPAVALPAKVDKKNNQYLKVYVTGVFKSGEIHNLTSQKFKGPGFKIISPFIAESGQTLLVDRGFTKEIFKNYSKSIETTYIEGNLLWPNEVDSFTPAPNRNKNIWFARDIEKMSNYLKTEPILLVATRENQPDKFIEPEPISLNIPNNHLQYAITWFSLSGIWFFMTIYFFWSRLKEK